MIRKWYPHVVSTFALLIALTMGGAYAKDHGLIGGKQIKNHSITAKDLAKGAVRKANLGRGAVSARAIGKGQVRSSNIAPGEIKASNIGRDQVTASAIGSGAVQSSALAAGAVQSDDIGAGQVQQSNIGAGQVGSAQIGNGQVTSTDIGDGQVTADDLTLPPPATLSIAADQGQEVRIGGGDYTLVATAGRYDKQIADSQVEVSWTGSAASSFGGCIFQVRIDGRAGDGATGAVYVSSGSTSTSATSMFSGLSTGVHSIEVWARRPSPTDAPLYSCTVGPSETEIGQTFVVTEKIA